MCLNFFKKILSQNLQRAFAIFTKSHPATDKMMSVQVYIFRFRLHFQRLTGLAVKAFGNPSYDPGDQGSDPGGVKFLIFQISSPLMV